MTYDANSDGKFTYDEFTAFCSNEQKITNNEEIFQIWQYFGGTTVDSAITIKQMNDVFMRRVK